MRFTRMLWEPPRIVGWPFSPPRMTILQVLTRETLIQVIRPGQTMSLDWRRLFVKTLNEEAHCTISEARAVGIVTPVWRIFHRLSNQRRPRLSQHEIQTTLHQYHLSVGDRQSS